MIRPFFVLHGVSIDHRFLFQFSADSSWFFFLVQGSCVRFALGPSLLGHQVLVLTNVPQSGQAFDRNVFHELKWSPEDVSNQTVPDNTELYSDVQLEVSGTFRYKFSMDGNTDSISGSGYFIVDPDLFFDDGTRLPMNAIQCQTILSKCLGSFDSWKLRLQVTKDAGYNMIHFTPVQELGSSNSAYSISNQLKLNPSFGDVDYDQLKTFIEFLNKNWSILSITDVVLNHTANETPWLKTNPEVGYNMKNCPASSSCISVRSNPAPSYS